MKKLLLACGLVCLLAACGNEQPAEQPATEPQPEQVAAEEQPACCAEKQALMAQFEAWDTMEETAKAELLANAKAFVTAKHEAKKAEMEAKGEAMPEMTEECKARCEAFANIDNLSQEEQKAFFMEMFAKKCNHEGEAKCNGDHANCQHHAEEVAE